MIHYDTLLYTMIHYDTLSYTILQYDTLWYTIESTETEHSRFCPSSRHCHYLVPPLPSLVVLVAPLPPHSTGRSVHLDGIMLSTSVERAPGKHVKSPGGAAWASKRNNKTAKSSKKQRKWQRRRRRPWQRGRDLQSHSTRPRAKSFNYTSLYKIKSILCIIWVEIPIIYNWDPIIYNQATII